jgi:hypothetical protein
MSQVLILVYTILLLIMYSKQVKLTLGSVHRVSICKCAQLDVTIYIFILAIKNLYMFRAFLAHPQE